jgi:predicted Rossmann fold flavoprotein
MADLFIIGAGAAGLATAVFARRADPALEVVVLDGARKPGAKILVSGGGRCNVTNSVVSEQDFWGGKRTIVRRILRALPVDRTVEFFRDLGVELHEEAGGKLFPDTNRARDVLDALLKEVADAGARIHSETRVTSIAADADGFAIDTTSGPLRSRAVVLATGGRSLPKTGSDGTGYALASALGHSMIAQTPALAPLLLDARGEEETETVHARLSGVSIDAELAIWIDGAIAIRLSGALLWTHFGISGPLALNASRHWERARLDGRDVRVTLNLYPGKTFEEVDALWVRAARDQPRATLRSTLAAHVPDAVARELASNQGQTRVRPGSDPGLAPFLAELTREERRRLVHAVTEWPLPVAGSRGYNFAEVTAGGVPLTEIDPATMESRVCPGLYLVGEILDVDGRIGGFNFQWAWSTAFVAGRAVAVRLRDANGRERSADSG